jgi:hypothetical protein
MELKGQENIAEIDVGMKNKFRWEWLQEKDTNNYYLSDYVRKLKQPGKV